MIIFLAPSLSGAKNLSTNDNELIENFVQKTSGEVVSIITSENTDDVKRAMLSKIFCKIVDIKWIGRFIAGKHWKSFSDYQKKNI